MARQAAVRKAPPLPVKVTPPTKSQQALTALARTVQNFTVELAPFTDVDKALAFQEEARLVVVTDVETHRNALELLRRGKALKRGAEEHWQRVTRWLDDRKREILGIKALDVELIEPGLRGLNDTIITYESAERERVRQEQERQRQEQERLARERREQEQAELERQALAAEAGSDQLSDRERAFVQRCYSSVGVNLTSERWLNAAAQSCGFKQDGYGAQLLKRPKIAAALEGMRQAQALREQAAAQAQKPVDVKTVEVAAHVAKVAGTRTVTTHTGEVVDHAACVAHFVKGGPDAPPTDLFVVNTVKLNEYARAMHSNIERWRGIRYHRKETKAG